MLDIPSVPAAREEGREKTPHSTRNGTPPASAPSTSERVAAYDAARGAGILAVVCLHALPIFLERHDRHAFSWQAAAAFDAMLMFAVPLFLMISTLLFTRSILSEEGVSRSWKMRLKSILWPYLFWSLICLLIAWRHDKDFTWQNACFRLVTGKSYYHLYFLGLVLQLYLLLPLLIPLFRQRPKFTLIAPVMILLTLAAYGLNRFCLRLPYVGSVFVWYIPGISLGLFLGSRFRQAGAMLKRWFLPLLVISSLSAVCYIPQTIHNMRGEDVNTFHYQITEWIYTNSMALFLLAFAFRYAAEGARKGLLQTLGRNTMPLYLLHRFPAILLYLAGMAYHWPPLPLYIVTVGVSLWLPLQVKRMAGSGRLSVFLFGR